MSYIVSLDGKRCIAVLNDHVDTAVGKQTQVNVSWYVNKKGRQAELRKPFKAKISNSYKYGTIIRHGTDVKARRVVGENNFRLV